MTANLTRTRRSLFVVVTGSRHLEDKALVYTTLSRIHEQFNIKCLAHGGATGADALAHAWAWEKGIQPARFDANWTKFKKGGGPKRNAAMLDVVRPNLVIAFPGNAGTADCVTAAKERKIPIVLVKSDGSFTIERKTDA